MSIWNYVFKTMITNQIMVYKLNFTFIEMIKCERKSLS